MHTCDVPADRVDAATPRVGGDTALQVLRSVVADAAALALLAGVPVEAADDVLPRVAAKLHERPVEDLRIDFEDGYGLRSRPRQGRRGRVAASAASRWDLLTPAPGGRRVSPAPHDSTIASGEPEDEVDADLFLRLDRGVTNDRPPQWGGLSLTNVRR